MKKTYIKPSVLLAKLNTKHMLATSPVTMGFGRGNANRSTTVDARESIWDDEEEEW
jgi:hypothetical protein